MIRAVIDTNVLASGLLSPSGNEALILLAVHQGLVRPRFSKDILQEYAGVLARPKFAFPPDEIEAVLAMFRSQGEFLRRSLLLLVISMVSLVLLGGVGRAAEERLSIAGLDVVVWRPDETAPTALPIVVFSHGFHGCAIQSRFLMTGLAAAGYLVVAPNHRDATCNGGSARWINRPEQRFIKPETWDETSFRDRADDIIHLVAALKAMPAWRNRIDWQHFGLVGHSLGGYTVLGLGGAWPGWKLDEVKAVLALSPYVQPFLVRHTVAGLGAPVMYQGGTLDFGITPALHKVMGAYDLSPAPKYYVELKGAGHFAWTDLRRTFHDPIVAYSLAFLDRYVRGSAASPLLTQATPAVAILRHAP